MGGVLGEVQEGCTPQLLLNDQGLLQQLEPSGQELVLDLQEISLALFTEERLIDDLEARVILDVLPTGVAMSEKTSLVKEYKMTTILGTDRSKQCKWATEVVNGRSYHFVS